MVVKNLREEYLSISQDIICRSLTSEVRVRWQAKACGIYGGESVMGQVLYRLFLCNFVSSQQYHTHISYTYNRSYIILAGDSTVNKTLLSLSISILSLSHLLQISLIRLLTMKRQALYSVDTHTHTRTENVKISATKHIGLLQ